MVSGTIDGNHCMLTIDTGSTITIIRPDILSREKREHLQPVSGWLRTVTGEKVPFRGKSELTLQIGSTTATQQIWVADIQDGCILGMDFLRPHGCLVNLEEDLLRISGEEVPLQRLSPADRIQTCFRVILEETVDLPPHAELIVPVKAEGLPYSDERWGILEPSVEKPYASDGLMIGRTLVNLREPLVPVCVMNLSDNPRRIKKGSMIAVGGFVQSVLGTQSCHNEEIREDSSKIPEHLQDLYQRSISGLNPGQQQQVCNCFVNFLISSPRDNTILEKLM